MGRQAARLIHKILRGVAPADIPIEVPEYLEFIINKDLVAQLGLQISGRTWRMANQVVAIRF